MTDDLSKVSNTVYVVYSGDIVIDIFTSRLDADKFLREEIPRNPAASSYTVRAVVITA